MRNMGIPLQCQQCPDGFSRNGAALIGRNLFNDSLWPACGANRRPGETYCRTQRRCRTQQAILWRAVREKLNGSMRRKQHRTGARHATSSCENLPGKKLHFVPLPIVFRPGIFCRSAE